ncbi:hypothetical protein HN385_06070 [archaeon]|jgi:hypothetical protein|nr:hypothetical protein [archaeon]
MKTFNRICIEDFEVKDESGQIFKVERDKEYLTSAINDAPALGPEAVKDHVIVFSKFWVPIPISVFAGEKVFTRK